MFSLKLLTNNYKLKVFGSFLVHLNHKDFKSLFIIGEFLVALLSFNVQTDCRRGIGSDVIKNCSWYEVSSSVSSS